LTPDFASLHPGYLLLAKFRQRFEFEMIQKKDTHFFVGISIPDACLPASPSNGRFVQ
jgi:hypothetical protein